MKTNISDERIKEIADELQEFFHNRKHADGPEFFQFAVKKVILALQKYQFEDALKTQPQTITLNT